MAAIDSSRASSRWAATVGLLAALVVTVPASPAQAAGPFVVDTAVDAVDAFPGDGVCDDGTGACTLRAAIQEANAVPGADAVTIDAVAAPTITFSLPGADEGLSATGDLDVRDDLTLDGGGATIDAAGLDRVLDLHTGTTTISSVTITGGRSTSGSAPAVMYSGGGIMTRSGAELVLEDSTVTGNIADEGGGIVSWGKVTVRRSTLSDNEATTRGGSIFAWGTTVRLDASTVMTSTAPLGAAIATSLADVEVVNSTISGNVGASSIVDATPGEWPWSDSRWSLRFSTVAGNDAPVAIHFRRADDFSVFDVRSSIVDHPAGQACEGLGFSADSIASDTSCGLWTRDDPDLGPLGDHGGPTLTHLPGPSSAALNGRDCDGLTTDQRGEPRPQGTTCDAGAVEVPYVAPLVLEVTTGEDGADAAVGDGLCDRGDGQCTLRAAVQEANAAPTEDVIAVAPGTDLQLAIPGRDEDDGATGDLDVTDPLRVYGAGATLDAGGLDRAFDLHGSRLGLEGLNIEGGDVGSGAGGAIRASTHSRLGVVGSSTIGSNAAEVGAAIATAGELQTSRLSIEGSIPPTPGGDVFVQAGGTIGPGDTSVGVVVLGATHADLGEPVGGTTTLDLTLGPTQGTFRVVDGRVDLIGDVPEGVTVEVAPQVPGDAPALQPRARNHGTIVLGGPVPGPVVMGNLVRGNAGTIEVRPGGEHLIESGVLESSGQLSVAAGASLHLDGPLHQTGGTTTVDGVLTADEVELGAGTLTGAGTIVAPLDAGACAGGCTSATWPPGPISIEPGAPVGTLHVDGAVALGSTTTVTVQVDAGAHDELRASGPVAADGALGVVLGAGVVPVDISVITSEQPDGVSGDLTTITGVPSSWVRTLPDRVLVDAIALFPDVPLDHPFLLDVAWAVALGLTTGYPDGGFHPAAPVTRQAAVTWLWRLAGGPAPEPDAPGFVDVPADHQFHDAIAWAAEEGITTGYSDGTFRPAGPVTRQAMVAWLWRQAGEPEPAVGAPSFRDVGADHPFHHAIAWAAGAGITTGDADGTFRPGVPVTRQAAMAFLHHAAAPA